MRATHLLQRGTGRKYPYAEHLAKRPDMLPCNDKGEILGGAAADGEPQVVINALQDQVKNLNLVLDEKNAEIVALRAEVAKLKQTQIIDTPGAGTLTGDAGSEAGDAGGSDETGIGDRELTIAEIVEAIGNLDPQNTEHFTKNKGPRVEALETVLKASVSLEQRDQAWTEFQAKA